ncbi:hypothetical protein [Tenacibaculum sp. 190524A02b]|uniref:hypothetical protein n=1 Tax=Tenacibaculum vairaonense TaxID=3137860 RepID=UPI0031FB6842
MKKDLEKIKEYYKDIFPSDVNNAIEKLIDEEIKKQEEAIEKAKKDLLSNENKKIMYQDVFNIVKQKLI